MTTTRPAPTIPLPPTLKHLAREETRPVHLASGEVAHLLEHWGMTRNGETHLRKLAACGVLHAKRFSHQRSLRFETSEVLAVWVTETGA